MKKLNRELKKWNKKIGAENNAVRSAKNMIETFNKQQGINTKNQDLFNTRKKYTGSQLEELQQIVGSVEQKDIYYDKWEPLFENVNVNIQDENKGLKSFEVMRGQYGIETYQDFIDFYDSMNRFKNDIYLSAIFSSEQYATLVDYAEMNGLTEEDVSYMAIFEYQSTGSTGGELYDFIYKQIDGYDSWNSY